MVSKFTPGPWEYLTEANYSDDYPFSMSHRIKIGKETLTIGCHAYGGGGIIEKYEANGQLIAAAPELYESCKEMFDYMREYCRGINFVCMLDRADKALAKAEGRG